MSAPEPPDAPTAATPEPFRGRRVLVTGAASGIGRRVADLLWQRGASVTLIDRDAAGLEHARAALAAPGGAADGGQALAVAACDVTDEGAVRAAVARAGAAMSGIDGVVCAAGIDLAGAVAETSTALWNEVLAVNLTGTFLVCREALAHLGAAGASTIVNVASAAALRPLAGRAAYSASKAAVVTFTKTLALEGAGIGLRANVVCPGAIDTPLLRGALPDAGDDAIRALLRQRGCAIDRLGSADEVAASILFLLGSESAFVTGAALAVDGGRSLW